MVDRGARDMAAKAVTEFMLECSITNWEYEERYPESKADLAIDCIFQNLWFWYDDMHEHRMLGDHRLLPEHKEVIERCLLFLQSDLEYLWPPVKWDLPRTFFNIIKYVVSFGTFRPREIELSYDEENFWPFLDRDQYAQAYKS